MFKRFLGVGLVSVALSAVAHAEEKSGLFAGIHGGLSLVQQRVTKNMSDKTNFSFNGGVNIGLQYFFVPFVGARLYASYDFNGYLSEKNIALASVKGATIHDFAGNFDILLNVINADSFSIGLFGGIGAGFSLVTGLPKEIKAHHFIMPINVGLNLTIAERHRIELSGKLPLIFNFRIGEKDPRYEIRPWIANIGYTFIF